MEYRNLLFDLDDGILTITINRPQSLNALNHQTLSEIEFFFGEEGKKRDDVFGVVLTGAGEKAFVAGADIKEFVGLNGETGKALAQRGQDIFFKIERFPKPVVAAITGFALGGGCEMAMACHMRIAGEKAKFGQPEVNLGIIPGYGGTQRLIQYIGKTKAIELIMTGDMIGASEALALGLVNYVVPPGEEISRSKALLRKIQPKGPIAISKVIEAVNAYFDHQMDGFQKEVEAFGDVTATNDFIEGANAFIEKRPPNFKGK